MALAAILEAGLDGIKNKLKFQNQLTKIFTQMLVKMLSRLIFFKDETFRHFTLYLKQ